MPGRDEDEARPGRVRLDLPALAPDLLAQAGHTDRTPAAPNVLDQFLLTDDPPRCAGQPFEEGILAPGEVDGVALDHDPAADRPDGRGAGAPRRADGLRLAAAKLRPDAGRERVQADRLGEEIVRPGLQPGRASSSSRPRAVRMIIGADERSRMRRQASSPPRPGMSTSSRMMSGSRSSSRASAPSPEAA
jgi:hypothetical protein